MENSTNLVAAIGMRILFAAPSSSPRANGREGGWRYAFEVPVEVERALRRVGVVPRWLSAGALVFLGLVGVLGWASSGALVALVVPWLLGVLLVVFSFRPKAWVTPSSFVVRSYLGTRVFRFVDVYVFCDTAYSGMWNRSADTESWLNVGMRMIDVIGVRRTVPIRAMLCGRRTSETLVEYLNSRVPQDDEAGIEPGSEAG